MTYDILTHPLIKTFGDEPRFVLWDAVKSPIRTNGANADSTKPATWVKATDAISALTRLRGKPSKQNAEIRGVGFVFCNSICTKIVGLDFDDCVVDGEITCEWVRQVVRIANTLTEVSQSGRGLHVYFRADYVPNNAAPKIRDEATGKMVSIGWECYAHSRYFALGVPVDEQELKTLTLDLWQRIDALLPKPSQPTAQQHNKAIALPHDGESVIERFNGETRIADVMARNGYSVDVERGKFTRPGKNADDGISGTINLTTNTAYTFSINDPAHDGNTSKSGMGCTLKPFDVFLRVERGGNMREAVRTAAAMLGMTIERKTKANNTESGSDSTQPDEPPNADALITTRRTDSGNADCLAALHGNDMRYVHDLGAWFLWDGTRWRSDRDGMAQRRARDTARARYHAAAALDDADKRLALAKWATQSEQAGKVEACLQMARVHEAFTSTVDRYDRDPMLAATGTATIDLRTGTARAPQREDYITHRLGVDFDPSATCPRWVKFLREIFCADDELIAYIKRAIYYTLTGDTREQKLFLCYGGGANGKSVFLQTLGALMGDYAATTAFSTFDASEQAREASITLAALRGKRFVSVIESDEDKRLAEARVKSVTGQDPIECRPLYGKPFNYMPSFKIWLAMNHKPVIGDLSHGMWRRIALIPFNAKFEGESKDDRLGATLHSELPGILNWAIASAQEWQVRGLGTAAAVTGATDQYRNESDVIGQWREDCAVLGAAMTTGANAAYQSYKSWAEGNGMKPMSATKFGIRLADSNFHKTKTMKGAFYEGFGLVVQSA